MRLIIIYAVLDIEGRNLVLKHTNGGYFACLHCPIEGIRIADSTSYHLLINELRTDWTSGLLGVDWGQTHIFAYILGSRMIK